MPLLVVSSMVACGGSDSSSSSGGGSALGSAGKASGGASASGGKSASGGSTGAVGGATGEGGSSSQAGGKASGGSGGKASGGSGGKASGGSTGTSGGAGGAMGGATASGGSAGGPSPTTCANDDECTSPDKPFCDTSKGVCAECTAALDPCPAKQYCDTSTLSCAPGCNEASDCDAPKGKCDIKTHQCVECLDDEQCGTDKVCSGGVCVAGCTADVPCPNDQACCAGACKDVLTDLDNCGACGQPCKASAGLVAQCVAGKCQVDCAEGFADCDGNSANGCEWNAAKFGPCKCTPGEVISCYKGPPGTEGVGSCKAGTQKCAATGGGFEPCTGQVFPGEEICGNGIDDDCNGLVDDVVDLDGDGWTKCDGDCCETQAECSTPELVNPGAFEFVGDGVDNDCDAATPDGQATAACSTASKFGGVTPDDMAKAMDLCQFTTEAAPLAQKKWGVISAEFLMANGDPAGGNYGVMSDAQTAVLTDFGNHVGPKAGPTFAGLSAGWMRDANDPGSNGPSSNMGTASQPPPIYLNAHNGSLPSSAGCSGNCPAGSGANDSVNLKLRIRVPTNAKSFSYQFRFFSYEYMSYQCTKYNDFYLTLLQTQAPGIPADHNISFDTNNNPVSVNNGFFDVCQQKGCNACPEGTTDLEGTGFEAAGGATKWLTTTAPVVGGEIIELNFVIFDVSDHILDSLTLLDNFSWLVTPSSGPVTEEK